MISTQRLIEMKTSISKLALVVTLLIGLVSTATAQGILRPTQTGVIQDLVGTGPFTLVISGTLYTYDSEVTEFFMRGEEITDGDLAIGMVVRFSIDDDILQRVEVLGPNNLVEGFDSH